MAMTVELNAAVSPDRNSLHFRTVFSVAILVEATVIFSLRLLVTCQQVYYMPTIKIYSPVFHGKYFGCANEVGRRELHVDGGARRV